MKKIIQLFIFFFLFFAISFVEYSFAYKEIPTQPVVIEDWANTSPIPDFTNCSSAFSTCASGNPLGVTYLLENCGGIEYEKFSVTVGDPNDCVAQQLDPIDCETCSCDSGFYRDNFSHACIPEVAQLCEYGIQNYLTGVCYSAECPDGDGTDAQCRRVPSCVVSEQTDLIDNTCVCTGGMVWNADNEICEYPKCDGENGSSINSIFDPETGFCTCGTAYSFNSSNNTCEISEDSCSGGTHFITDSQQCEVAPVECGASGYTTFILNTFNNTCTKRLGEYSIYNFYSLANHSFEDRDTCIAIGGHYHSLYAFGSGSQFTPLCVFAFLPDSSSSSLSLNSSSMSSATSASSTNNSASSSAVSASSFASASINSGGGSGSSSGTNTSSGGGNGGDGSGDGSGGNGTSAGSAASSGNNSSSGAGECDPEAKDYFQCIAPDVKPLPPHSGTASGATSVDQVNQNFNNRLRNSPIVGSFDKFKNIISVENSECPILEIDLSETMIGRELSTDIHCQVFEMIRPILSVVMFAVFTFLAFRIFASA